MGRVCFQEGFRGASALCCWRTHTSACVPGCISAKCDFVTGDRFLPHAGKNSRVRHGKAKAGLFGEIHTPWTERGQERETTGVGLLARVGLVISYAGEQEDYSNYAGEGTGTSRHSTRALTFCGQPRNCHGACGCAVKFKVSWESRRPPSWF